MKNTFRNIFVSRGWLCQWKATLGFLSVAAALLAANTVSAQTTNAYDSASDPAYTGDGAPNGLSPGGQNGGFGFGAWTFTVNGATGGAFTAGSGPSGASWDLWNMSIDNSTVAVRPFGSPLVAGQTFSVQIRLNNLDNSYNTNQLVLQDSSGKTIFSYWHTGFEPNGAVNGSYSDATTNDGAAVGFSYNFQQFCAFSFTLNSATTYTFSDLTAGHTFSGAITGSIAQVAFIRGNGDPNAPGNGQDFQFDALQIVSSAPPSFSAQTPAPGSYSASPTNISLQVIPSGTPINPGSIVLTVDGSIVTPVVSTVSGVTTIAYLPGSPLSAGSLHTAQVTLADNNNTLFTNTWSFTTGFLSLPATLPGPIVVSNSDITIFTSAGDAWLGTNYGPNSSRTVYVRFSMAFNNLNGETGSGGGFGGLQFFQGPNGNLIVGNSWLSLNWSLDTGNGEMDLNPATTVVFGEWHTIIERVDYSPGVNATVNVWLDPDFSQTEANQPNSPLTFSMDDTFDNIQLRTGNGTTSATFTNIVIGSSGTDVGIPPPAPPSFQGFIPGNGATSAAVSGPVSVQIVEGTIAINTSTITMTIDGNSVTPVVSTSGQITSVSYQPSSPFAANSSHTVVLNLADKNGTPYSTTWSFTLDAFPSLPVTVAGPIDVTGGGLGITIFSNLNGWISGNYESTSTNTLYTRFSMVFFDVNGETGSGGAFGGLEFYQETTEGLLVGNSWISTNWSANILNVGEYNLLPITPIVLNEWHTMVVKNVYSSNAPTAITIWLDPDFTQTEGSQSISPLTLAMTNTFDTVNLRCGNGTAYAEFTNVVFAATAPGVGFAVQPQSTVLNIAKTGGNVNLSWIGAGTLLEAPAITGPWTAAANQTNPQVLNATNNAQFYRVQQ